jgi:putative transposase
LAALSLLPTKMQLHIVPVKSLEDVPSSQKRGLVKALDEYVSTSNSRNEAIYHAFSSGGYAMKEIGEYFDLHYSSVSKIVKNFDAESS